MVADFDVADLVDDEDEDEEEEETSTRPVRLERTRRTSDARSRSRARGARRLWLGERTELAPASRGGRRRKGERMSSTSLLPSQQFWLSVKKKKKDRVFVT